MLSNKKNFDNNFTASNLSNDLKNSKLLSASQERIYDEDDVQRYDADTYRQKYGDRWKKLASSVRDVVQPDGTIIREYVIDDPALLEQLSEDDDNFSYQLNNNFNDDKNSFNKLQNDSETNEINAQSNSTKSINENLSNEFYKSSSNFSNNNDKHESKPKQQILNQNQNFNSLHYNTQSANFEINQAHKLKTNSSPFNVNSNDKATNDPQRYNINNNIRNMNSNTFSNNNSNNPNIFQPISPVDHSKSHSNSNQAGNINTNKAIKDEDDVDKEVENIHEQGLYTSFKLKYLVFSNREKTKSSKRLDSLSKSKGKLKSCFVD